jgi:hypothetical protein
MMKKHNSTIIKGKTEDEKADEQLQKMRKMIEAFERKRKPNKFKI